MRLTRRGGCCTPFHPQKTGEQLLSMFRQLLVVCHGLLPAKDWEALLCYARWADMLWLNSYTGALAVFHVLCGYAPPCATEEEFVQLDERAQEMVRAFKASSFEEGIGQVSPGGGFVGVSHMLRICDF